MTAQQDSIQRAFDHHLSTGAVTFAAGPVKGDAKWRVRLAGESHAYLMTTPLALLMCQMLAYNERHYLAGLDASDYDAKHSAGA
jgi:hypothetical protein